MKSEINSLISESVKLATMMVREGNKLPRKEEIDFHKNSTTLGKQIDTANGLLEMKMKVLTKYINPKREKIDPKQRKTIAFANIVYFLDDACENIDATLDKLKMKEDNDRPQVIMRNMNSRGLESQDLISKDDDSQKPQNYFTDKVDNSDIPFIPKLRVKNNAKYPIQAEIEKAAKDPQAYFKIFTDKGENLKDYEFEHPYEKEIEEFQVQDEYLQIDIKPADPGPEKLENYLYVDTWANLKQMMAHLHENKEIAIDLEHHSYRSFLGITCLIQISTRTRDFVVDAISLRDHLHVLNEVTSDPSKLKVLHGAKMDVQWLQRDFGVYIVNLFDTMEGVSLLGRPPFNYASLLLRYAKVSSDKSLQLADWRVRPLTASMVKYAIRDTHYLLFIYDCLKVDLKIKAEEKQEDPVKYVASVWSRSKPICLNQFQKPQKHNKNYYDTLNTQRTVLTKIKLQVFKKLWDWRFEKARLLDDSPAYIMSNSLLTKIAHTMPSSAKEIMELTRNPPVKLNEFCRELLRIIQKERENEEKEMIENDVLITKQLKKGVSNPASHQKQSLILQEDPKVKSLTKMFSEFQIVVKKPQNVQDGQKSLFLFTEQAKVVNQKEKSEFHFSSHFEYLKRLYPHLIDRVNFSASYKPIQEQEEEKEHLLKVSTGEYMDFEGNEGAESGQIARGEREDLNIQKMLNNTLLPPSLRERFNLDLLSKKYIKKEERKEYKKAKAKKVVVAKLQEQERSNMFEGTLFEKIKEKRPKQQINNEQADVRSAFNHPNGSSGNSFWEKQKKMENQLKNSRQQAQKPSKFGLEHSGKDNEGAKKNIQKNSTKFGRGKQAKNFRIVILLL